MTNDIWGFAEPSRTLTLMEYCEEIGIHPSDLKIDRLGQIYVLIEGYSERTFQTICRRVNMPLEFQTEENLNQLLAYSF